MNLVEKVLVVLMSIALTTQPAVAARVAAVSEESEEPATVVFIATADSSFEEVVDSLVLSNATDDVSDFLQAQADAEEPLTEYLALEDYPEDTARDLLNEAADEVESGEWVDESLDTPPSFTGEEADGDVVSALEVNPATFTSGLFESDAEASVAPASLSTALVKGGPVNNNYSWRYSDRAVALKCTILRIYCWYDSWADYRVITGPGKTTSRTDLNVVGGGDYEITGVRVNSTVLSAGRNISDVAYSWNEPVYGETQWNGPHSSTKGKTFQMYYKLTFYAVNGAAGSVEYKTGKSAMCAEPTPGAYRCKFN